MATYESSYRYTAQSGLGNSAAYQVSGYPSVTSGSVSTISPIAYNKVTSQVVVSNHGASVVSASFDGGNYFGVPPSTVVSLDVKCREVRIIATDDWSVCAALTSISKDELPTP